jgi:hypothetical protein
MAITANEALNQVLVNLDKSLLSYVSEAWPWTSNGEAAVQPKVAELVARRRENVARLADLLIAREWPIEFGAYPTAYTDLHYVALDYLLALLVEDEKQVATGLEQAVGAAAGDAEAAELLRAILAEERDASSQLQALARSRSPVRAG